jgi:nucleotide-binding universal stress UspA family protein
VLGAVGLGSVSSKLLRHGGVPVCVVPPAALAALRTPPPP